VVAGISDKSMSLSDIAARAANSLLIVSEALFIDFSFLARCATRRDDVDVRLICSKLLQRMDDEQEENISCHSDCLPSFLAALHKVQSGQMKRIVKNQPRRFEANVMFLRLLLFLRSSQENKCNS
jgi:hypothetical protein